MEYVIAAYGVVMLALGYWLGRRLTNDAWVDAALTGEQREIKRAYYRAVAESDRVGCYRLYGWLQSALDRHEDADLQRRLRGQSVPP